MAIILYENRLRMVEGFLEGQYYFVGDEIENIQNFFFLVGVGLVPNNQNCIDPAIPWLKS